MVVIGLLALVQLLGCGGVDHPEVGKVRGVITLDGEPLANTSVVFQPSNGRPSLGTTDEKGQYSLLYLDGVEGAMLGQHKVMIRTEVPGEDGEPPIAKERLPPRYHNRSELTADVVKGKNTFDFPLTLSK